MMDQTANQKSGGQRSNGVAVAGVSGRLATEDE